MKIVIYMESMFLCYLLLNTKVISVYYLLLINPCKFMSDYLYFLNNLENIKDHLQVYVISCKTLFPRIGKAFQRKRKLLATPFVY